MAVTRSGVWHPYPCVVRFHLTCQQGPAAAILAMSAAWLTSWRFSGGWVAGSMLTLDAVLKQGKAYACYILLWHALEAATNTQGVEDGSHVT